jgi:hypothetical protein
MQICTFNIPCFVIVSSVASRQNSIWKLHQTTKLDYFCQMCKLTLSNLSKKKDFLAFFRPQMSNFTGLFHLFFY